MPKSLLLQQNARLTVNDVNGFANLDSSIIAQLEIDAACDFRHSGAHQFNVAPDDVDWAKQFVDESFELNKQSAL